MAENYSEEVKKRVIAMVKPFREEMTERVKKASVGVKRPSDAEVVAFYRQMLKLHPPELWMSPEGEQVMVDAWSLDLMQPNVIGGHDVIRRIEKASRTEAME